MLASVVTLTAVLLVADIAHFSTAATATTAPTTSAAVGDHKIQLALYYESLCPGCREFVTDQLLPNYEHAKRYVDFVLVPFGHASVSTIRIPRAYKKTHNQVNNRALTVLAAAAAELQRHQRSRTL